VGQIDHVFLMRKQGFKEENFIEVAKAKHRISLFSFFHFKVCKILISKWEYKERTDLN